MAAMGGKQTPVILTLRAAALHFRGDRGISQMKQMYLASSALVCALIGLTGCWGEGEHPFLLVQFCLTESAGPDELRSVLSQIAERESIKVTDRSADSEAELKAMNSLSPDVQRSFPLLNMSMRGNGIGLGASNLGLPANQVVVGFGGDTGANRAFAKRTLQRLRQTWTLVRVPDGRGAFPLKTCPDKT